MNLTQIFPPKILRILLLGSLLALLSCKAYKQGKIIDEEFIVMNSTSPVNSEITQSILPYQEELNKQMSAVLNYAAEDLVKGRPESKLGNLLADLSFQIATQIYQPEDSIPINFCLLNEGGMRASIAKGPITLGEVFELMPFENELVVVTLSYEKTMEIFNYLIATGGEPISNAELIIVNETPYSVLIDDEIPDSTFTYKVLTSDYLARGGDKMNFFLDPINHEKVGIKLRDAIILYLEQKAKADEEITSKLDGRIRYE
jgi:2',3'-cyclic-nucleotide 2'-phosphodiesterase (5'-nucleotidase family)